MLAAERYRRIAEELRASRVVATEDVARRLGVSPETVRRDLMALERQGVLLRVHGGATARTHEFGEEPSFEQRSDTYSDAKRRIARTASTFVESGQTIAFDIGTTVLEAARALPSDFRGTVATCSLLVAAELAERPGVDVLVAGGRVRPGDLACRGHQAVEFFENFNADIAFLGSGGASASSGLTDFHLDEVATRRAMIRTSARSYALVLSGKFDRVAPHRVCALDQLEALVTDRVLSESTIRELDAVAARIVVAESDAANPHPTQADRTERALT